MTNYEKIKSMSIEEMAEYVDSHEALRNICKYCEFQFKDCSYVHISCNPAIKKWLESEAEK